jgi:hopene-associated glycosyltransferase HpnB
VIWVYLLFCRGRFWVVERGKESASDSIPPKPHVVAVIPARNESETIARAITSLLRYDPAVMMKVVLVDDESSDATAALASAAAASLGQSDRLTVLSSAPWVPSWTGKLWALSQGVEYATSLHPDYLLLTDADIEHDPRSLDRLLAIAKQGSYDLTSYMVKLQCRTLAELALIPAFVFFFFQLYPPQWVSRGSNATAGAAGGCILIRPQMLQQIGGLKSIRGKVIDDCALANAVKSRGGRLWLGLTDHTRSLRSYGSFSEIRSMISRTAFNQLSHSNLLLVITILGLLLTYISPLLLLVWGDWTTRLVALLTWVLMSLCYLPMVRFYTLSPLWSMALPAVAGFYGWATIDSAVRYWAGNGGNWKGRKQDRSPEKTDTKVTPSL